MSETVTFRCTSCNSTVEAEVELEAGSTLGGATCRVCDTRMEVTKHE